MREELDFKSLRFFSALYRWAMFPHSGGRARYHNIGQPARLFAETTRSFLLTRCLSGSGSG